MSGWDTLREIVAKAIYPEIWEEYDELQEHYEEVYKNHIELAKDYATLQQKYEDLSKMFQQCKLERDALKDRVEEFLPMLPLKVSPVATISIGELKDLLRKEGFTDIEVADSEYYVWKEEDLDAYIEALHDLYKDRVHYTKQIFDCDDFAELLHLLVAYSVYKSGWDKQIAFGEGWSNWHAFNVAVVMDEKGNKKVVFYEPQTGKKVTSRTGYYAPREAFFTT